MYVYTLIPDYKQKQMISSTLFTGAPHFKSIAKHHRHANFNLEKVLNEAIDNVIKKATKISIFTEIDSEGRLQELKISDNYVDGFVNINEHGINNPFNMGHIKSGHDDDEETSEFGVGLKAAALSASNYLLVVSKVESHYYEVICDFIKMEKEDDVNASYNPKKREIMEEDYNDIHPFDQGSSIVMSKILGTICEQTTQKKITERIKKGISDTYSRFFSENMEIRVNGEIVEREHDYFLDPKCMPFTVQKSLFILEKPGDKIFLIRKTVERTTWQIYNKISKKWEALKDNNFIEIKKNEGYISTCQFKNSLDGSSIKIDTTFAFYSDTIPTKENGLMPEDVVLIYKDNRKYCKKSFVKHNNGAYNYTLHKIEFDSKKIGKELGITFNKEITMDGNNDLIIALKSAVHDSRLEFSADTCTSTNKALCAKAIKLKILDWTTCDKLKLASYYRDARVQHEENEARKVLPTQPKPIKKTPEKKSTTSKKEETKSVTKDDKSETKVDQSESKVEETVTKDDKSEYKVEETVTKDDKAESKVEETVAKTTIDQTKEKENIDCSLLNSELSKKTLSQVIDIIQDTLSRKDFVVTLENSRSILDFIQKNLK
jgi:hypothetical protein